MNGPVDLVDGSVLFTRFRVDFGYAGTAFHGWAKQPGLRTVEGHFLDCLTQIFGSDHTDFGITVAGRTDAGVHAHHQVLHIDLSVQHIRRLGRFGVPELIEGAIRDRLNSLLDADVRVHAVAKISQDFDARFAATYRRYRYRIADASSVKDPIEANNTLWLRRNLDVLAMQAAGLTLCGLHDFASFCRPRPFSTTIRELREVRVARRQDENRVIEVHLLADAFCHNMVRSIVGALIAVGEGRATVSDVKARLDAAERTTSFKVVEPKGLTLMEIGYPDEADFARQVSAAKDLRSLPDGGDGGS